MPEAADFELEKEPQLGGPPESRRASILPWIVAAALIGAAGAALYYYLVPGRDNAPAAAEGVASTDAPVATAEPLGVDVPAVELPPLDASDMLVRELVRGLSAHPTVAAWLATDGLIRNFTVVVENIAAGRTPSRHLRPLKPEGAFTIANAAGTPVINPSSYARYNNIGEAAASVDAEGAARLYSTLKPRIEEAYAEIGNGPFDRVLETAIVRLLEVPAVEGEVALTPKGALYNYNDSRLERLTQAQKQLLRMGPRNVRTIQRTLRDVALALGVPVGRLPPR